MALEKLLVGKFYAYVAPSGEAHDATLAPASPWALLGTGWNVKGEGIKIRIARTYHDVEIENELEPIDSLLERVEHTITLVLSDWSAEAIAYALHGNQSATTTTAAATDVAGSKDVSLEFDSDISKLALTVIGPSPYLATTGAYNLNVYYPLVRLDGDWETEFMLSNEARNPIMFKKLKHATLNAKMFMQNAAAL